MFTLKAVFWVCSSASEIYTEPPLQEGVRITGRYTNCHPLIQANVVQTCNLILFGAYHPVS